MSEDTNIRIGVCDHCSSVVDEDELVVLFYDDGSKFKLCKKCDALEFGTSKAPENPRTDSVDIHKIIDDAMAKGDRSVYILIHSGGMSVTINPYAEEKPKWFDFGYGHLKCSDCGHYQHINLGHDKVPTYCSNCGEKMHGTIKKELEDDE